MVSICLSRDEIEAVTERKQSGAQARVLRALGIDFKTRPDGSLLVLREALQVDTADAKVGFSIDWTGRQASSATEA